VIDLAALASCSDLTSEHAKQAASSAAEIRILLKRVSEIAKPGEGCPKVLMAIARLVGQPWVEGDLRVELSGDETSTTLAVMCEYGVGIRERLIPASLFAVPIDEFERALELAPHLVLPLRITDEPGKLVLTPLATPEAQVKTVPPPEVAVDSASLGDAERTTAPPPADELQVVDEASPEDLAELAVATATPIAEDEADEARDAENAEHQGRMESGPVPSRSAAIPGGPDEEPDTGDRISNVHTRPTVRRMVAVDAAAIAAVRRRDPRREED
jgi:hypothetical protein